jgi:hypothetical protein
MDWQSRTKLGNICLIPSSTHYAATSCRAAIRQILRCRGSLQGCDRHREGTRGAQPRPACVALARQALPIDRPPSRSARRPRACARGLHADAGNARDRRGAGTVGRGCSIVPREKASARGQLPLCVRVFRVGKVGGPLWAESSPNAGDHWKAGLLDAHRRFAMSALRRFC